MLLWIGHIGVRDGEAEPIDVEVDVHDVSLSGAVGNAAVYGVRIGSSCAVFVGDLGVVPPSFFAGLAADTENGWLTRLSGGGESITTAANWALEDHDGHYS